MDRNKKRKPRNTVQIRIDSRKSVEYGRHKKVLGRNMEKIKKNKQKQLKREKKWSMIITEKLKEQTIVLSYTLVFKLLISS